MAHLHTNAPCPPEYLELQLCRDVYHCTPAQLREVPLDTILVHLACIRGEQNIAKVKGRGK